jgi:hypothetical protein
VTWGPSPESSSLIWPFCYRSVMLLQPQGRGSTCLKKVCKLLSSPLRVPSETVLIYEIRGCYASFSFAFFLSFFLLSTFFPFCGSPFPFTLNEWPSYVFADCNYLECDAVYFRALLYPSLLQRIWRHVPPPCWYSAYCGTRHSTTDHNTNTHRHEKIKPHIFVFTIYSCLSICYRSQ